VSNRFRVDDIRLLGASGNEKGKVVTARFGQTRIVKAATQERQSFSGDSDPGTGAQTKAAIIAGCVRTPTNVSLTTYAY